MIKQLGFNLLEALLAMVVINIGLLAIVIFMQINSQHLRNAYEYSVAITRMTALTERLRLLPYIKNSTIDRNFYLPLNLINNERTQWQQLNSQVLPYSHSDVHCQEQHCHLLLTWGRSRQTLDWDIEL